MISIRLRRLCRRLLYFAGVLRCLRLGMQGFISVKRNGFAEALRACTKLQADAPSKDLEKMLSRHFCPLRHQ